MLRAITKAELLEMLSEVPNDGLLYITIPARDVGRAVSGLTSDGDVTLTFDGPVTTWQNNLGFSITAGFTHEAKSIITGE